MVKSIKAAKAPPRLEGSSDRVGAFNPDHYDDDKLYTVRLSGVVNYPEGTENWLTPDSEVRLSGKAVKIIGGDKIKSAAEFVEPPSPGSPDAYPSTTNLFSVKGFKGPIKK